MTKLQKQLDALLTITDVCRMFGKSAQTIFTWRQFQGLPYITIPGSGRDTIRFERREVKRWAKKENKEVVQA